MKHKHMQLHLTALKRCNPITFKRMNDLYYAQIGKYMKIIDNTERPSQMTKVLQKHKYPFENLEHTKLFDDKVPNTTCNLHFASKNFQ